MTQLGSAYSLVPLERWQDWSYNRVDILHGSCGVTLSGFLRQKS